MDGPLIDGESSKLNIGFDTKERVCGSVMIALIGAQDRLCAAVGFLSRFSGSTCRLPALLAALLLPATPPLLLGTAVVSATLLVSQPPARAQSAEAVAKVAQAITVRIEGATQGSGVLVKRDGNRYTVLTAWHVVSGQRPGEEFEIYTPDGHKHQLEQGSIKRVGEVDMAVLTFTSLGTHETARVADVKSVSMGNQIFVAGFPLTTSAVPTRLLRFLKGDVIANATVAIPNGYQLLYSNPTLPGMSGGAVLNDQGQLVGIHGQGETDSKMSEQQGVAVKTGTNQAVPIAYYSQYSSGAAVIASSAQAATADDYLAQANRLLYEIKGGEEEVPNKIISLANKSLKIKESAEAYLYRAVGLDNLNRSQCDLIVADSKKAIALRRDTGLAFYMIGWCAFKSHNWASAVANLTTAISLNNSGLPSRGLAQEKILLSSTYYSLAWAKNELGQKRAAIADYDKALILNPTDEQTLLNRSTIKLDLKEYHGALSDSLLMIKLAPSNADGYRLAAQAYAGLGQKTRALEFLNKAINDYDSPYYYDQRASIKYALGDLRGACIDYKKAATEVAHIRVWLQGDSGAWCRTMR